MGSWMWRTITDEPKRPDAELATLCGEAIGSGSTRSVYQHIEHPDLVIKEQHEPFGGAYNLKEWTMFHLLDGADEQNCLARVLEISASGRFLVMEKLKTVSQDERRKFICPTYLSSDQVGKDRYGVVKVYDYAGAAIASFDERACEPSFMREMYAKSLKDNIDLCPLHLRANRLHHEADELFQRAKVVRTWARLEDERIRGEQDRLMAEEEAKPAA